MYIPLLAQVRFQASEAMALVEQNVDRSSLLVRSEETAQGERVVRPSPSAQAVGLAAQSLAATSLVADAK